MQSISSGRDTLEPGAVVGIVIGVLGVLAGVLAGCMYQRYLAPNNMAALIESRQRRRDQNIHSILSISQDSSHGLVQLSDRQLDSLSIDFSDVHPSSSGRRD